MTGRKTTTIEVSLETYDLLVEQGRFPETMDECVRRLINGHTPKRTNLPGLPVAATATTTTQTKKKKKKVRHKVGCEYCNRVFLARPGLASHMRHFHPEHYRPKNPVPLSERKTVIYRTAEGESRRVPVEDFAQEMEKEA